MDQVTVKFSCIRLFFTVVLCVGSLPAFATSLYNDNQYESIVSADRSLDVGDILTIVIYESSSASQSLSTDASTTTDVGISADDGSSDINATLGAGSSFNGGGAVNRSGKIVANVSAIIQSINEQGGFELYGEQKITLNNEVQLIRISGIVRPEDISQQNTVVSTRMADLKLDFIGDGLLTKAEKPGLITRFFKWLF